MTSKYQRTNLENNIWVITENGHDYKKPLKAVTFAFDTETIVLYKDRQISQKALFNKLKGLNNEGKRQAIENITWAYQCYDEFNGFFMTNNFYAWLAYQCKALYQFGWCYNSTFDFAQIDYEILAKGRDKWNRHEYAEEGKAYNKAQAWTYESLHNDMGARYSYKLWVPYRNLDGHKYVHAVEYRDFMKLIPNGLRRLLEDLDIKDNDGQPVRKLEMEYQAVDPNNLTENEIDYCANDVKGLYFAIKKFNEAIEKQSNGELSIFGSNTNIMTAGGYAKAELLRSLYPNLKKKQFRLKRFQKQHPLTAEQDAYFRQNKLYRGGICYVNPRYKGKLLTASQFGRKMNRYDVNSEYPYSMAEINDLIGQPFRKKYSDYLAMTDEEKAKYETILCLKSVSGKVKKGYLGLWYDPFMKEYVDVINENKSHFIFEREFNEMLNWYDDVEIDIDEVILIKKGAKVYAKFVNENYELKAEAKRQNDKTTQTSTKLKLNSSYGKLAERLERGTGHYELNEETGAVHFVSDGVEVEASGAMNVIIGSLITAYARVYILSSIRAICKNKISKLFVYIDTDSIHAFADYDKADAYKLGGLKLEATCEAVKYLAPKTYIDIEKINADGTIDFIDKINADGTIKFKNIEIHSKGVNVSAIYADLMKKQKFKKHNKLTLKLIDLKINYGVKYICLCAMNVKGGKVLLPTEKYLARPELAPNNLIFTNYGGQYLYER